MAKDKDLEEIIQDFARDLAAAVPDSAGWGLWLGLLLEELEKISVEKRQPVERFDITLDHLKTEIAERLESHNA
jgi:hypothetical protein